MTAKAQKAPLSAADKAELEAARTELAKVTKAKTECMLLPDFLWMMEAKSDFVYFGRC